MLTSQIKAIDLLSIVEAEGIQLKSHGKYRTGLCPFHAEKTPSFIINTEKNRWTCYGCGEYGDAADFIQKYHGFNFQEMLSYLGIESKPTSKEQFEQIKKRIREAEIRRERREAREQRERELAYTLGTLIRWTHSAMRALTPGNLHVLGGIMYQLPWWEWGHSTLTGGDKIDRAYVLYSFKGFPVISRRQLFRKNFDFEQWLRDFCKNGATENAQTKQAV